MILFFLSKCFMFGYFSVIIKAQLERKPWGSMSVPSTLGYMGLSDSSHKGWRSCELFSQPLTMYSFDISGEGASGHGGEGLGWW